MAPCDIRQSKKRSQLRAPELEIRMKNTSHPQIFRDLNEHRAVFDLDHLSGLHLGDVQREPKDGWVERTREVGDHWLRLSSS